MTAVASGRGRSATRRRRPRRSSCSSAFWRFSARLRSTSTCRRSRSLQEDFGTSPSSIQLTLSAATVGFAVGQLIVGPWSDSIGRRRPLLVATGVHVAASVAIALAPDITWLVALRVLQGAGAAGGAVVATAMIRDVAAGRQLLRGLARMALFTGIAPVIAPFLGAQLMTLLDWRGLFIVVAGYGLVMLVVALAFLPETLPLARRFDRSDRRAVWNGYRGLFRDRRFVGVALTGGLMVSSVFAYLSTSSFVFQQQYALDAQAYGLISAGNAVAFVVGTQVSALAARRLSPFRILSVVLPALALTGFSLTLIAVLNGSVWVIVAVMLVFMMCAGACGPCLGVLGLSSHADTAGTAAALMGATNFGLAGLASPIVGAIGTGTFTPLGIVMGVAMTGATVLLWTLVRMPRSGTHTVIPLAPERGVDRGQS